LKHLYFLTLIINFLLACISFNASAQIDEKFTDGDFTSNPSWTGDAVDYVINSNQLQSNSTIVNDTFYLSTNNTLASNCQWEFYIKLQFNTSSANYVDVYLNADQSDLKSSTLNGYFVRVGNTSDEVSLYKNVNGTKTIIINGTDGITNVSNNTLKIKVIRDASNNFSLFSDITGLGSAFVSEGTVTDNTFSTGNYFGFSIKQSTASFFQKHFFDDIYVGPIIVDTTPPTFLSANATSSTSLDLDFDESLDATSAQQIGNYLVNNSIGSPTTAQLDGSDNSLVHLTFSGTFLNGITYTITASNIKDLSNNNLTFAQQNFSYYQAQPNDVVINEIMADPDPAVLLPSAEFIELYNTTNVNVDITNWTISDGGTPALITSAVIPANSYIIICDDANQSLFTSYGIVATTVSFPSLNNTGDNLTLKNQNGLLIFSVSYSDSWYKDNTKKDGGWTIEQINPLSSCSGTKNWIASTDASGGTPGTQNSVYSTIPDIIPPDVVSAEVISNDSILITFSETLDSSLSAVNSYYQINNGIGSSNSISILPPDFITAILVFNNPLQLNNYYTLIAQNFSDCSGNIRSIPDSVFIFIPDTISLKDIIINEVMYNPPSYGFDYVEIYNNSDKILDLKDLKIANTDATGVIDNIKNISNTSYIISPQSYAVVTEDTTWLSSNYINKNSKVFIEINDLPSYNDDESSVVLLNQSMRVVDSLHYFDSWQFPLLESTDGVSLERISFNGVTQDSANWRSCATAAGNGTPGIINSQVFTNIVADDVMSLTPQVFSPDQDGYNDYTLISLNLDKPNYVISIKIFDENGSLVRDLLNNETVSESGFIVWDGITDKREKAPMGAYIVFAEVFDLDGKVARYKKTCFIAGK
jgi:hypothetical protein